ncbi:four helix bundle protein [Flavobacterium sp.]|jgi:four helix bundle protein|uniref:four helix bundle protein n=1 Tax=Flavobacterium sp. TaxID=239 RepID=UPI00333E5FA5
MKEIMKNRTKKFALDCWILCSKLPKSREFNAYVSQLIRCSSSVGANYRALQRAKSNADFINKLKIIEEEADESHFFLELLYDVSSLQNLKLDNEFIPLTQEANEITAIIVSTLKTVRNKS